MPITVSQRRHRRNFIGASDVAAIMGLDPHRTSHDVYLEKTTELRDSPNEAMRMGSQLEEPVLGMASDRLGHIRRNQFRSRADWGLGAHLDAILLQDGIGIEAKTVGILGPAPERELWGEFGTDEVPYRVIAQVHVHMAILQTPYEYVAALIGGRGFGIYRVLRSQELIECILRSVEAFIHQHVMPRRPPTDTSPSLETVKAVMRRSGASQIVDPSLIETYRKLRAARLLMEKDEQKAQAALLAGMGDADIATNDRGEELATYREQLGPWRFDREKLERDGLLKSYAVQTKQRVLRLTKRAAEHFGEDVGKE